MASPAFFRPRQVAELLGVTERTIRRWIRVGTLTSCRIGGARLVARADLERVLGAPLEHVQESDDEPM